MMLPSHKFHETDRLLPEFRPLQHNKFTLLDIPYHDMRDPLEYSVYYYTTAAILC